MNQIKQLKVEKHCYVLLRGNWIHPIAHFRHDLLWYPENGMTILDQFGYRPFVKTVVTECPWIIAMYPRERVFIVDEDTGQWVRPDYQTYAMSVNHLTMCLLHWNSTIPAMALDGGEGLKKTIETYADMIRKANIFYGEKTS
jgi:hypothetical protein